MPPCHWENTCRLGAIKVIQERILEITTVVLKQHLQAASSGLPTVVLDAIVQSTVHYLVGLRPKELEERRPGPSSVLLVQLSHIFFMTYGAPPDTARAVAITLAAAAFATHAYPGGEKPQFNRDTREKRAASVYEYYRAQKSMPKDTVLELFIFGFFGVLPQIDFGDESTQAAATLVNFSQLIRNLPLFDFSRDSTIYTLPRGYSLNAILERSIQSLISFSDKRTSIHEVSLAYNWVPLLIHSFNTVELYIPALLALCRAESVEVQDLCLQFIDRQWTATEPLNPLKSTENRGCLEQLCLALIDRPTRTPVASIAALHFELLVARIIICSASGFPSHFEGQSALRPLLNLQGEFAGRISQPKRHNVRTLLSGLEECCKGNLTAEEHISHTMQSIADFCESTILGFEPFRREEKLKALETLKNQLKPSSDRVARQNQVDPRNAPSNALPNLELLNSETDISVVIA
ncbi:hypothetical protein FRC09_006121 [Ceratobasidium sp. 395]|nr:hypothetical protein FRC09_006121 [Ceratobasidium sp. 395]